jgi:hypothetical protein
MGVVLKGPLKASRTDIKVLPGIRMALTGLYIQLEVLRRS